ncbi:MAG: 2Fe-2S iron-sulfur cluster-binding protein [Candidatus Hydrogenedentota bacterium]
MSNDTMTIIIDGYHVPAAQGQTIMQAATAAGIYIPHLCYHPDLPPAGHCRLCTVRVNGKPTSACTFPVSEGLVIESDTEELNAERRRIVEMLFIEGNHYCPTCEASGNCELQAMAYRLGMISPQMPYMRVHRALDATHPDVYLDRDRCILCGRCVRASRLLDGKSVFGFENRGIRTQITVNSADGLGQTNLSAADKAPQLCPTGCLMVKRVGYEVPMGQRLYDHEPIGTDIERQHAAE